MRMMMLHDDAMVCISKDVPEDDEHEEQDCGRNREHRDFPAPFRTKPFTHRGLLSREGSSQQSNLTNRAPACGSAEPKSPSPASVAPDLQTL